MENSVQRVILPIVFAGQQNLYSCDKQNSALQSLPAPPRVKTIRHPLAFVQVTILVLNHSTFYCYVNTTRTTIKGQVLVVVHAVCERASEKCGEAQEAEVRDVA